MTRMSGYSLVQCPVCGEVHRKKAYSSVSIYMPRELEIYEFKCAFCNAKAPLDKFLQVGFIDLFTEEENERRYAQTLFALGLGPAPPAPPLPGKRTLIERLTAWAKRKEEKQSDEPWKKYPELNK